MHWRAYTPDDLETYARLRAEAYPDYPLSAAQIAQMDATRDPDAPHARLMALENGQIIGALSLEPPMSNAVSGEVRVTLATPPEHADAMLLEGVRVARDLGATALRAYVQEGTPRHALFVRHGFTEADRMWDSALKLEGFDFSTFEADAHPSGLRVKTLEGHLEDEAFLRAYHAAIVEIIADVPSAVPFAPWSFEVWRERTLTDPMLLPDAHFIGFVGDDIAGVSQLFGSPLPGTLQTGLTGVRRAHRGRGIGMALKLQAVRYAVQHGAHAIRTSNHVVNQPMLAINDRLGFNPEPARLQLRLNLGHLGFEGS
jgi:GNAT superfamily N-acetyltransferase